VSASLESLLMAFAAEKARVEGMIVDMAAYRQRGEGATQAGFLGIPVKFDKVSQIC